MKAFIDDLIRSQVERYKDDHHLMVADYNRERETIKGYNGRQLLELLQNCDDEGSAVVQISIDAEQRIISISNNGSPFSESGYRSLFIANLSSKRSNRQYIGSKGLGFRSVINWSDAIEIQSNGLSLIYSEQNRIDRFNSLFDAERRTKIRVENGFNDTAVPMPFLTIPLVKEIKQQEYVTTISIHYKQEFLNNILDQIKKITTETLLFLRNIQQVKFMGFSDKEDILCLKKYINKGVESFVPTQQVSYEGSGWVIFEEEQQLPDRYSDNEAIEKEFYQIKIAVEDNLKNSTPFLYSFFPTNIRLNQPYILHATFDLDSTRNQLNNSEKNIFILKKVVDFTIKVAKYFKQDKVNYRPLQILQHVHRADTLSNLGYYELIERAIKTEAVFPCINNTYKSLGQVIHINDQFARMLLQTKATHIFDFHLLPIPVHENIRLDLQVNKSLAAVPKAIGLLNQIGALDLTIADRSFFITQVVLNCQFIKSNYKNQLGILVNIEGEVIPGNEYIYTPVTDDIKLHTPSYTKIHFLNRELFDQLLLDLDFKSTKNPNKNRFIYDQLVGFCNIHSYEPATLAQKIISATSKKVGDDDKTAIRIIKEMNACLFKNFKQIDTTTRKQPLKNKALTITISGIIKPIDDIVLSQYYPTGKLTTQVFDGINNDDDYISSPESLGIVSEEDIQEIEDYLLWLGANKFARYSVETSTSLHAYSVFVRLPKNIENSTGHQVEFINISNFEDILRKISPNKLILWIYFDSTLKLQMNDATNKDVFKNYYRTYTTVHYKPSYLKYMIQTKYGYKFQELLIDEKYTFINDFNIDYRSKEFVENQVSRSSINEILVSLGAKDDFNAISIQKVAYIINKLPTQFPDGKGTQSFYKKALGHYIANRREVKVPLMLFAINDTKELKVYKQEEIYFSDKIKLPKRLRRDFPILNFPARAGGSEAIRFFKINDLRDINIEVISHKVLSDVTSKFRVYFDKIKPLILTQRINEIEETKQRKLQANICNKIEIILCSELRYQVKGNDYEAMDYEFLHYENTYYISVRDNDQLVDLQKNYAFNETVADIISLSFDVSSESNEFKLLLNYDYEQAKSYTLSNYGEDTFQEALELLGLADYKHAFWYSVLSSIGVFYDERLDDFELENLLKDRVKLDFDLSTIDYQNLNNYSEIKKVEQLFNAVNLSLEVFAKNYPYKIGLSHIHADNLRNKILSRKVIVKAAIWKKLQSQGVDMQSSFLKEINKYEDYEKFVAEKSKEFNLSFMLDTVRLVTEFEESIYGKLDLNVNVDIDKLRSENYSKFTNAQQDLINQDERLKSLVYFESAIPEIIKNLGENMVEEEEDEDLVIETVEETLILDSSVLEPKHNSYSSSNPKSVYTPKHKDNKALKRIGNRAESVVYEFMLRNGYSNVYHASQDNEGLHYDIRYTDAKGRIKYVEVKTFDYDSFILSVDEYQFGTRNREDYEIWLVNNLNKIIPIKDFFINKKYLVSIKDYVVHLQISKQ